jgi:DNA-binding transcriptional regulator YiaG
MANIATLLKDEISRLSRREIRKHANPLRKATAAHRREIAALKRQVLELQRRLGALARTAAPPRAVDSADATSSPLRFVAKGLRSLRARLGLSASDLARLLGVTDQSVYNWELKKAVPRKEQLARLATIRSWGKREAQARLAGIQSEPKARPKAKAARKRARKTR